MRAHSRLVLLLAVFVSAAWVGFGAAARVNASQLQIGAATISITPEQPVLLSGQLHTRVSQHVDSPLTASVLALESRDGAKSLDQAIMVACDLVAIREGLLDEVRAELKQRLPDLDPQKVFLSATHTHTAPETIAGRYTAPPSGIMSPDAYSQFLVQQIVAAIEKAWQGRRPGSVGWGLGHAVVAQNRLAVSDDGRSKMYGPTSVPGFVRFEGYEDHGVEVLCCWDADGKLIATAVNVACPAQEVESKSAIDADIWHPIREALRKQHGDGLVVLGWTGAAGDQSPHLMFRKAAEERMRTLRGLDRLQEIARRVVGAWEEAYAGAVKEKHADATLVHRVQTLELPIRQVTQEESLAAKAKAAEVAADPAKHFIWQWQQAVVDRFERQRPGDAYPVEIHVLRLGDVAIATNPFELYTDYGVQMKARSPALQTFVIQLTGPPGTYLPTDRAAAGGAYGAVAQSSTVGPAGGRVLVERTLETMGDLWPTGR